MVKDIFEHVDITITDIERVMLRKCSTSGVQIEDNGDMTNINYTIVYDDDSHTGTISIVINGHSQSLKFLNYPSLVKFYERDNLTSEQFSKMVSDKVVESQAQYFYTQKEFGLGLFNCYCPLFGHEKNDIMSKLLSENICGTSYIGLENHLNEDSRIMPLDTTMINKILNFLSTKNFKQKNGMFCNIFYELSEF